MFNYWLKIAFQSRTFTSLSIQCVGVRTGNTGSKPWVEHWQQSSKVKQQTEVRNQNKTHTDTQTSLYKTLFTLSECLKRRFPLGRHLGALLLLVSEPANATVFSYWSQLMVTNGSVFRQSSMKNTAHTVSTSNTLPLIKNLLNATNNANH